MARSSCIIIGEGVRGELSFDQAQEDAPTRIDGTIEGLTPGEHGIHIHTFGDFSQVSRPSDWHAPRRERERLSFPLDRLTPLYKHPPFLFFILRNARGTAGFDIGRRHLQPVRQEPRRAGRRGAHGGRPGQRRGGRGGEVHRALRRPAREAHRAPQRHRAVRHHKGRRRRPRPRRPRAVAGERQLGAALRGRRHRHQRVLRRGALVVINFKGEARSGKKRDESKERKRAVLPWRCG